MIYDICSGTSSDSSTSVAFGGGSMSPLQAAVNGSVSELLDSSSGSERHFSKCCAVKMTKSQSGPARAWFAPIE